MVHYLQSTFNRSCSPDRRGVERVSTKKGKYGDYVSEIEASLALGFQAWTSWINPGEDGKPKLSPLYTWDGSVYAMTPKMTDITAKTILHGKNGELTYYIPSSPVYTLGARGEVGPTGKEGPKGPRGAKGDRGASGDKGAVGPIGPQGVQGAKGDQGIKGETGGKGPEGPIGPQGIQGATGDQGIKGETGAQGPEGPKGKQGSKGDKGDRGGVGPTSTLRTRDSIADLGWIIPEKVASWFRDQYATARYYIGEPLKDYIHPSESEFIINLDTLYNVVAGEHYHKGNLEWAPYGKCEKSRFAAPTHPPTTYKYDMFLFHPSYVTKCKIQKGDTIVIHAMYKVSRGQSKDRYLFQIGSNSDYRGLQFLYPNIIRISTHKGVTYDYTWQGTAAGNPCNSEWAHLVSIVMNFDLPGTDSSLWIDGKKAASFDMSMPSGDIEEIVWWRPVQQQEPDSVYWGVHYLLEMYHDNHRVREGCVYARSKQLVDINHLPSPIT